MESLNLGSGRTSPSSTSSTSTTMIEEMESLNLESEPGSPSPMPSTSPASTSSKWGGWYPIPDPWKRNDRTGHQIKFLLDYVDWEQHKMRCEQLHSTHAQCEILPLWASGTRHLIRKARFEDGTNWVLKIPFPEYLSEEDDDLTLECTTKSNLGGMELEYETTLAFQTVCDVRVPNVYAMDNGSDRPFPLPHTRYDAPCLYMEYLEGVTAADRLTPEEPPPGTLSFLHKQLAQITAKMMNVACPISGTIGIDPETRKMAIDPSKNIGHGFFETPKAFYEDLGRGIHKEHLVSENMGFGLAVESRSLMREFLSLYAILAPQDSFCLINGDLGFHNVLTNDKWEITAVIDIDCVQAMPWSWALKPLSWSCMDVRPNSLMDTSQLLRDFQIGTRDGFHYFLREIVNALGEQGNGSLAEEVENFLKSGGRELMLGLEAYQWPQPDVHMGWLEEYAKLPIQPEN